MKIHLSKHGIFPNGIDGESDEDKANVKQKSLTSVFRKQAEDEDGVVKAQDSMAKEKSRR
jgi:hypothetical protein